MKTRDWQAEVEDIDGQLRALLEHRTQLLRRADADGAGRREQAADDTRAHARPRPAATYHAHVPHPEAHLAFSDLP